MRFSHGLGKNLSRALFGFNIVTGILRQGHFFPKVSRAAKKVSRKKTLLCLCLLLTTVTRSHRCKPVVPVSESAQSHS